MKQRINPVLAPPTVTPPAGLGSSLPLPNPNSTPTSVRCRAKAVTACCDHVPEEVITDRIDRSFFGGDLAHKAASATQTGESDPEGVPG
jgi:hypothetical protein